MTSTTALVRHRVADFDASKKGYLRSAENPNDVVVEILKSGGNLVGRDAERRSNSRPPRMNG